MIKTKYIYYNFISFDISDAKLTLCNLCQKLLCSKYFMAAAKCFDLRKYVI